MPGSAGTGAGHQTALQICIDRMTQDIQRMEAKRETALLYIHVFFWRVGFRRNSFPT